MIAHHIDPLRRIITTRVSGRVSVSELVAYLYRLMRDPKFNSDFNALIVAMDVEAVAPATSAELFAPIVRAWSQRRVGAKWAFVLPNTETKNLAESALNEVRLTSVSARCFVTEAAAFAWLAPTNVAPERDRPPHAEDARTSELG